MDKQIPIGEKHRIAEAVRHACIRAALEGYEHAAQEGLCDEGAWECAVDAIRALDVDTIIREFAQDTKDQSVR